MSHELLVGYPPPLQRLTTSTGINQFAIKSELHIHFQDGLPQNFSKQLQQPGVAPKLAQQLHKDLIQIGAPQSVSDMVNVSTDPEDLPLRRLKKEIVTQKKEISGLNSKLHRLKQTSDDAAAGQGGDIAELVTTLQTLTTTLNKVAPSLLALTQTPSPQSVLVGAVADDTIEAQHYETWKANPEAQKLATTMAPMITAIVKKEINALVAPSSGGLNPYETEYYDRMAKVSGLGQ